MLDRGMIGYEFETFVVDVERGRIKFFAKVIGETNPIYLDESAARDAGYRDIPATPTFPVVLDSEGASFETIITQLKINIANVLHGSQEFEYFRPICAGDRISVAGRITDVFDKKGGALEFLVTQSTYTNQHGELAAKATNTLVVRNG